MRADESGKLTRSGGLAEESVPYLAETEEIRGLYAHHGTNLAAGLDEQALQKLLNLERCGEFVGCPYTLERIFWEALTDN